MSKMNPMQARPGRTPRRSAVGLALTLLLTLGQAGGGSAAMAGVLDTAPQRRYTDEAINRDWAAMEALQARLDARADRMDAYARHKAAMLIEFVTDEYEENDRSGVIAWALDTARDMIEAPTPEAQRAIAMLDTPSGDAVGMRSTIVEGTAFLKAARLRPGALPCAAEALARYDTTLVWLAHEEWEVATADKKPGHERSRIEVLNQQRRATELALAPEKLQACIPKSVPVVVEPPPPATLVPPPPLPSVTIPSDVLFRFDGGELSDMLDDGRQVLADHAARWKQVFDERQKRGAAPLVIVVTGHTDRLGNPDYNMRLSLRRAATVRTYLSSLGVDATRLQVEGRGSSEPVSQGCADSAPRRELISCLRVDRRVRFDFREAR